LILAAAIVGFSKTGVAGVGILNPVLFAMIFADNAAKSVGLLLPMLIMADIFAVGHYRKDAKWNIIFKSLPWVFGGILAAYLFMRWFSGDMESYNSMMKLSVGIIVLAMMGLSFWLKRHQSDSEDILSSLPIWITPFFGIFTGIATMLANAAGPIYSIFLLTFLLPKKEFMGTRALAFFIINWVKVPLQADLGNITAETLTLNACLFPAIGIGAIIGVKTLKVIPEKTFRMAIQVLVVLSCAKLILSAI